MVLFCPCELCRAAWEKGALVEIFTVILRDAWGSAAEIPASVHIRVVDKAPPSILFPAKDKTGARESQAERSSLSLWPRPGPGLGFAMG